MRRWLAVAALLTAGLAACGDDSHDAGPPTVTATPSSTGKSSGNPAPTVVRTVATGLAVPWGLDFLPDGRAVVTERDSRRVLLFDRPSGRGGWRTIGTIDSATPNVEAGLLGVAVSPTFEDDHLLYFYESTTDDNRIVRATFDGGLLAEPEVVLDGIPAGPIHDGGRLAFGPDGYLYASTGETGDGPLAQDRSSLAGKILRITPDGEPAPGNPDPDSPVWSYGHRNVQGWRSTTRTGCGPASSVTRPGTSST